MVEIRPVRASGFQGPQGKKMTIKFLAFCVKNTTNGKTARVHYSLDNTTEFYKNGRKCVTVYHRDYGHTLGAVFEGTSAEYKNDTDAMTDYFDKGLVRIYEGTELFAEARKAVEAIMAKEAVKRDARHAARTARYAAKRPDLYGTNSAVQS
jgi:hypothetical protein